MKQARNHRGHCAISFPMIHLNCGAAQKFRGGSGQAGAFFVTLLGSKLVRASVSILAPALVLEPGICHVLHRTALLSQLVTRNARDRRTGQLRGRSAAGTRARRTAASTSSQWPPPRGTKVAS